MELAASQSDLHTFDQNIVGLQVSVYDPGVVHALQAQNQILCVLEVILRYSRAPIIHRKARFLPGRNSAWTHLTTFLTEEQLERFIFRAELRTGGILSENAYCITLLSSPVHCQTSHAHYFSKSAGHNFSELAQRKDPNCVSYLIQLCCLCRVPRLSCTPLHQVGPQIWLPHMTGAVAHPDHPVDPLCQRLVAQLVHEDEVVAGVGNKGRLQLNDKRTLSHLLRSSNLMREMHW